jgi:uncharacterized paraquat-inducible protein A
MKEKTNQQLWHGIKVDKYSMRNCGNSGSASNLYAPSIFYQEEELRRRGFIECPHCKEIGLPYDGGECGQCGAETYFQATS